MMQPASGVKPACNASSPGVSSVRVAAIVLVAAGFAVPILAQDLPAPALPGSGELRATDEEAVRWHMRQRLEEDRAALEAYRPGYPFWQHVFTTPDGTILYGSAADGHLLAAFPQKGDWLTGALWMDGSLSSALEGQRLGSRLSDRRDQVAELLEARVGPVVHNATRGDFLLPNLQRYGAFLDEWGAIYDRFGVPPEIGLGQAMVESGLNGTIRSPASALGLCQWLPRNWERLKRLTPHVIEGYNQTTQAAYCAAYLMVLSTKYGSFIPALSEHHAGVGNVGKLLVNGARLGAEDVRSRYLRAAEFARDIREIAPRTYRDVVGTYGARSFLYSEMVFGNGLNVRSSRETIPQERIYAHRARRSFSLEEITRMTGLSSREVKRFNPALVRRVPKGATLYLPEPVEAIGPDVSFWHQPAPSEFAVVLNEFVRIEVPVEEWEEPAFEARLEDFRRRFRGTGTEEGIVMDAVLGYVLQELPATRRILAEYRSSDRVQKVFDDAVRVREESRADLRRMR